MPTKAARENSLPKGRCQAGRTARQGQEHHARPDEEPASSSIRQTAKYWRDQHVGEDHGNAVLSDADFASVVHRAREKSCFDVGLLRRQHLAVV